MVDDSLNRTGASLLIDALQKNGINNLYGVVGIPITDLARLAELRGMKYYGFRREDSAVDAAAAAGFLTKKPGVAMTVSAPGFLNGLTALAQATKNCFPLIMISGSSERHIIDLAQGDYEGLDQYNVAKPFCKKAYRVDRAQDVGLAVARAIRTAVSGRPGGVYLDLPADTIAQLNDDLGEKNMGVYKLVDPAPLQGDLTSILNKLVPALTATGYKVPSDWLDAIAQDTAKNDAKFAKRIKAGETNPEFGYYGAIEPINDYFQEHPDTYLVSEGANTLDIGRDMIGMKLPRHRLDTGTWGVMGVGMGYAIATAVETGKHVVALDGDSAFGFDGMDVETMCRYNLPITVVVINNGGIYNGVDNVVPDQLGPTTLDPTGRYDLIAKAFGGDNYYVTNYQEVKDTFATAVDSGRPSIINVQIDPSMGKESGHIGNLNPELNLKPLEEAEQKKIDKE